MCRVCCRPPSNLREGNVYRPQRSWGKVIFSEACVKNSVHRGGGCLPQCMMGYTPQEAADTPQEADPLQRCMLGDTASYWNAYLFHRCLSVHGGGYPWYQVLSGGYGIFGLMLLPGDSRYLGGKVSGGRLSGSRVSGVRVSRGYIYPTPKCWLLWQLVRILLECFLVENALKLSLPKGHSRQAKTKKKKKKRPTFKEKISFRSVWLGLKDPFTLRYCDKKSESFLYCLSSVSDVALAITIASCETYFNEIRGNIQHLRLVYTYSKHRHFYERHLWSLRHYFKQHHRTVWNPLLNGTKTVISVLRVHEAPLLKSHIIGRLIVINSQNVCSQTVWTKLTLMNHFCQMDDSLTKWENHP